MKSGRASCLNRTRIWFSADNCRYICLIENIRFYFCFAIALYVVFVLGEGKAVAQIRVCPDYREGDYWIFNSESVDLITQRSNELNGTGYKTIYKNQQFVVEGYPYSQNTLILLFPCSGESELVKLPIYAGLSWVNKLERHINNKLLRVIASSKVIDSKMVDSSGESFEVFLIHRKMDFGDSRYNRELFYYYAPSTKSIVLYYVFNEKSLWAAKIYLTATGTAGMRSQTGFNADSLIDPALEKRFADVYLQRPR